MLDGLRLMLEDAPDMICVGTASDGRKALGLLAALEADVLLLDINHTGMKGVTTCRAVHTRHPGVRILVLSMLQEARVIRLMLRNGASGYLLKSAGREEVLEAIRRIRNGQNYYSREVSEAVMDSLCQAPPRGQTSFLPELTCREKEVLRLIVDEHTTAEIAERLGIKFGTVETHRRNLLIKLGARNTAGLVRNCLEYGLLEG